MENDFEDNPSCAAGPIAALLLSTPTLAAEKAVTALLVGTPWIEAKAQSGLPGPMMIFLPKGKLLIDSCWETYALRTWKQLSPNELSWDEDGATIRAKIKAVSSDGLTLQITAGKDVVERTYAAAKAPYVCPDMKR
ncbi:hypothetical protein WGT02_02290 [Rhizobium sp. T1470]|uniref:hypothetical protein n=1 Tax=unclassified Rhizobium TaxID=2613769 RepID=UPI001AAFE82D|nr:hypothetical protein [Rhizobium sp. T1473]MCA0804088.1 hypothetical protein [Rhizobium sp. T1473]